MKVSKTRRLIALRGWLGWGGSESFSALKFKSSQAICHRLNAGRKGREALPAFSCADVVVT
jgi:hypothetical protein